MFKNIQKDKWRHFYVGIAMGIFLQVILFYLLPSNLLWAIGITFFIVIAISYGFELFSLITGWGVYDVMDAVASIIGGTLGMLPVIIYYMV